MFVFNFLGYYRTMASSWRSRRILGLVQTENNQELSSNEKLEQIISHEEVNNYLIIIVNSYGFKIQEIKVFSCHLRY